MTENIERRVQEGTVPPTQVNVQINNFISGKNGLSLNDLKAIDQAYPELNFGSRILEDPLKESEHRRNLENGDLALAAQQVNQEGRRILFAQIFLSVTIIGSLALVAWCVWKDQPIVAGGVLVGAATLVWRANLFGTPKGKAIPSNPPGNQKKKQKK